MAIIYKGPSGDQYEAWKKKYLEEQEANTIEAEAVEEVTEEVVEEVKPKTKPGPKPKTVSK
jgi:hypothetical protein